MYKFGDFWHINFLSWEYRSFNISEFRIKLPKNPKILSYSCHREDRIIIVKIIQKQLYFASNKHIRQ